MLSSVDARLTYLGLVEPGRSTRRSRTRSAGFKFRGSSGKVNLAVDRLPDFTCLPGEGEHLRGAISYSAAVDDMEQAYDDAKYGHWSRRPYIDMIIPTLVDPTMAPPGKHVISCFVQYAPYHLDPSLGTWDDNREAFGDAVIDRIAEVAPNIRDIILHRQVLTPLDIERTMGLTEGNIFQGELSLEQLFFNRPVPGYARFKSPIRELWLCGSSTHPGGGIMGANGRIAALEVLKAQRPEGGLTDGDDAGHRAPGERPERRRRRRARRPDVARTRLRRDRRRGGPQRPRRGGLPRPGRRPGPRPRAPRAGRRHRRHHRAGQGRPGARLSPRRSAGSARRSSASSGSARHGLSLLAPDVRVFAPQPDGRAIVLHGDLAATAGGLRAWSARDAERYAGFDRLVRSIGGFIAQVNAMTPPDVKAPGVGDVLGGLRLGGRYYRLGKGDARSLLRVLPMAIADFVAESFDTDALRGTLAARAIHGTAMGPWSAGTTNVFLTDSAGNDGGAAGQTVYARGGPGGLSAALAAAVRERGGEIRTGAEVAEITTADGRVTGVRLASGEEIARAGRRRRRGPQARPHDAARSGGRRAGLRWRAANIRTPGTVATIGLALRRLPRFTAAGDGPEAERRLRGRIVDRPGDRLPRAGLRRRRSTAG